MFKLRDNKRQVCSVAICEERRNVGEIGGIARQLRSIGAIGAAEAVVDVKAAWGLIVGDLDQTFEVVEGVANPAQPDRVQIVERDVTVVLER